MASCAPKRQQFITFSAQKLQRRDRQEKLTDLLKNVKDEDVDAGTTAIEDAPEQFAIVALHGLEVAAKLYEPTVETLWTDNSTTTSFVGDLLDVAIH